MGYEHTHYGTGYYIYSTFVPGAKLSSPLHAWNGKTGPGQDVVDLVRRSGEDLLPPHGFARGKNDKLSMIETGPVEVPKDGVVTVVSHSGVPSMLRAIDFSVPSAQAVSFGRARLRITWDDRSHPSVDAPIALFFGAGTLYNRDNKEYLVKAFPVHIRFTDGRAEFACYFPMPYFKSAKIELVGNGEDATHRCAMEIAAWQPYNGPANHVGYFHATYRT